MKILQISSARTLGGGERHFADLAQGLAARGHEVYAALAPGSPLRAELSALPPPNFLTLPLRNSLDLAAARRLARFARDNRIEIMHAHLGRDYTPAAYASWRAPDTRLVITRHVLFPLNRAHRLTLARVGRVIAVSGGVARGLRARRVVAEDRIRVVHNGIDFARLEAAARGVERAQMRRGLAGGAKFVVGTVGELSRVKGQEGFVRAAKVVERELGDGVVFLIVGEDTSRGGETRARVERLIAELKMSGRVRLLGRRADVAPVLSALDVFVNPSRSEAFGLATIEAMACGAPVVSTATEGAQEVVEDGVTGRLVPVGDDGALARAVIELLKSPSERGRMSESARAAARVRFSLERMVAETENVYREALASP